MLLGISQKLLGILREISLALISVENHLGLSIRSFIALDRIRKVLVGLRILLTYQVVEVGKILCKGAIEEITFLCGFKVLSVNPNHVDVRLFGSRFLLCGKLG